MTPDESDPLSQNLAMLTMIETWMSETLARTRAEIQKVEDDPEASGQPEGAPLITYPPCPICGSEVTSFSGDPNGPVLVEWRPCGNKIVSVDAGSGN
jgi:hypothetical protein